MVKLVVLSLVFSLLLAYGSALSCMHCTPNTNGKGCTPASVACNQNETACVLGREKVAPHGLVQKCISLSDCKTLRKKPHMVAKCCQTDNCNKLKPLYKPVRADSIPMSDYWWKSQEIF